MDDLIEHFRDKERRKEFFKEYKEIEMLYEIISPDAFLRPYIDDYATLSRDLRRGAQRVHEAGLRRPGVPEEDQRAGAEAHRRRADRSRSPTSSTIDADTIELIKQKHGGDGTKVINLIKSIEKTAEEESGDPFLIAMADRAKAVQESFEDRQTSTADALDELLAEIETNEERKKEQAAQGPRRADLLRPAASSTDDGIPNPEAVSKKVGADACRASRIGSEARPSCARCASK